MLTHTIVGCQTFRREWLEWVQRVSSNIISYTVLPHCVCACMWCVCVCVRACGVCTLITCAHIKHVLTGCCLWLSVYLRNLVLLACVFYCTFSFFMSVYCVCLWVTYLSGIEVWFEVRFNCVVDSVLSA